MKCQYRLTGKEPGQIECSVCGHTRITRVADISKCDHNCTGIFIGPQSPRLVDHSIKPSLVKKVANFIPAVVTHAINGFQQATEEIIEERFETCQSCDKYEPQGPESGSCNICGCSIGNKQIFMNKAAWSHNSCPLGKWKR